MGSCFSVGENDVPPLGLDLSSKPNDAEALTDDKLVRLLSRRSKLIEKLSNYHSCDKYIKDALSDPTEETEGEAWKAVQEAVDQLYKFYVYSLNLDSILEELLTAICYDPLPELCIHNRQASIGKLAQILHFAIRFDELKMSKPAIQNDFSYYRRVLARICSGGSSSHFKLKANPEVNEEVANKMSFHFAYPVPVMKLLSGRVTQLRDIKCIPTLSLIANVCCDMITNQCANPEQKSELLCLMTGCIIFVDHLAPRGVFYKNSTINIKQCVVAIKLHGDLSVDCLLNEIRLSSLHLKDDSTMSTITRLFD